MIELYQVMLLFAFYSLVGWAIEIAYHAVTTGKYVNRGFLSGPICPVYGFGVILVLAALTPIKENFGILFVGAVILTSLIELITGWLLYKCFGMRWWDYTKEPFNIGGYICLRFSIMWGLACVIVVRDIEPIIYKLISIMPVWLDLALMLLFYIALIIDSINTITEVLKLKKEIRVVKEFASKLQESSIGIGENIAESILNLETKANELAAKRAELEAKLNSAEFASKKEELLIRKGEIEEKGREIARKVRISYDDRTRDFIEYQSKTVEELATKLYQKILDNQRIFEAFPNVTNEMIDLVIGDAGKDYQEKVRKSLRQKRMDNPGKEHPKDSKDI